MGYELDSKALQIIARYKSGSLRLEGGRICFGRRCGGRIKLLGKTREFGKLD